MNFKILCLSAVIFFCLDLSAQSSCGHAHERNEFGLSGGAIRSFDHGDWGSGVHVHYFRTLTPHSRWSVGAMLEQVWVHGEHFTVGAGIKYQLFSRFSVGVLPGVTFLGHDEHDDPAHSHGDRKTIFSTHVELVYDLFHAGGFHLGPAVDLSLSQGDSHGMIGIHCAYSF